LGDLHLLSTMNDQMKQFLSCDWGTSSFRLKLVETRSLRTIAELHHNIGIATTYTNWQSVARDEDRFIFFASVISSGIGQVEAKIQVSLTGVPVILSGMASSTLGMIQLPYKQMPFKTDGSDLKVECVKASTAFPHDVFVISGVCSDVDVMRGEETQLVGSVEGDSTADTVYIFPGTHSKHISVKDGVAHHFRTYMTGEIFALLAKNSTLTQSLGETADGINIEGFIAGVRESVNSNLLHQLFHVRSRFLLDNRGPEENRGYLSGLLIGNEVHELSRRKPEKIVIVSSGMGDHYKTAIEASSTAVPVSIISDRDVAIRGQLRIVSQF
jgi:2-dehydro-3-deoxygalactonokinase